MKPTLLVFDLDGTLIDSRRDLADATNALLADLGAAPLPIESVTAMVGEGAAVLVRRALTAAGLDPATPGALDRFLAAYDQRLLVHTRPYPGIADALDTLRTDATLAVLTNKPTHPTSTILTALALAPYFAQVIGGDTPYGRKPDPAGLLHIVRAVGASPESTMLVGDSRIDRETAQRAGTPVCLARYGFGFSFAPESLSADDLIADSPAALVELLGRRHQRQH